MMTRLTAGLCLVALFCGSGCLDYRETIVLQDDGSGTIHMRYAIDRAYFEQMEALSDQVAEATGQEAPEAAALFDRTAIEDVLAEHQSGIQMLSYETSETDRDRIWDMSFSFTDINQLYLLGAAIAPEGEELDSEEELPEPIFTRQEDGTWLFVRAFDDAEPDAEPWEAPYEDDDIDADDDTDEDVYADEEDAAGEMPDAIDLEALDESMEELATAMEAMGESAKSRIIRFSITFPGRIVESNATAVDGATATWEYHLDEIGEEMPEQRAVIQP